MSSLASPKPLAHTEPSQLSALTIKSLPEAPTLSLVLTPLDQRAHGKTLWVMGLLEHRWYKLLERVAQRTPCGYQRSTAPVSFSKFAPPVTGRGTVARDTERMDVKPLASRRGRKRCGSLLGRTGKSYRFLPQSIHFLPLDLTRSSAMRRAQARTTRWLKAVSVPDYADETTFRYPCPSRLVALDCLPSCTCLVFAPLSCCLS